MFFSAVHGRGRFNNNPTNVKFQAAYKRLLVHTAVKGSDSEAKPFMDGNIVKECMMEGVGELCPEKLKFLKMISLSCNTVARRIDYIGNNILHQITASDNSMYSTTTGEDIFKVQKTLTKYNLDWNRHQGVTIDDGRNMSGPNIRVVGQTRRACEGAGASVPIFLHYIIHQQALCVKHIDMRCVLKPVVSVVNFIRSHALNHRKFRCFLEQIESKFVDLYYTAVRWLSCGKVLLQFFQLRNEINLFLAEKNHPEPLLFEAEWL
ncbi:hypothetical protein CBL_02964 [Carabus blaptoides fortunei]